MSIAPMGLTNLKFDQLWLYPCTFAVFASGRNGKFYQRVKTIWSRSSFWQSSEKRWLL